MQGNEGERLFGEPKTAFVPTALENSSYSIVTGGQVVGIFDDDGSLSVESGLWQRSRFVTADIPFDNGVIHVMSSAFTFLSRSPRT